MFREYTVNHWLVGTGRSVWVKRGLVTALVCWVWPLLSVVEHATEAAARAEP